ncbi:hypothetical protein JR064_00245 [Xanthomonas sp. CFBP 8703]|uniref:Transmembrane protein n=1 Tax=Xanthomonas bonasiae TaxID=2810351 RepID=A0ABS3AW60_9XANT|nr:hypothetical protein [Xanthomonas bonasiae]MBN6100595.1 hypothetical protein [Xanthomonas bonasiae]
METAEGLGVAPAKASITEKMKIWWLNHPWVVRLYLGGAMCMLSHLILFLRSPNSFPSNVALYAGSALLVIAFLGDAYEWLTPKIGTIFIKVSASAVGAIVLAVASGVGRTMVNGATHQQPSLFPVSTALLTLISVVPVTATLLATIGAIPAIFFFFWAIFKYAKRKVQLDTIISTARGLGGIIAVFGALTFSSNSSAIYPAMQKVAAYSAFFFDLQKYDSCAPLEDDRVSRINDSLVVIGRITETGPQFVRRTCLLQAETTVLAPPRASIETQKPASKRASLE